VELAASSEDPEVPETLGIRDGWKGGCKTGKTLKGLEVVTGDVLDFMKLIPELYINYGRTQLF